MIALKAGLEIGTAIAAVTQPVIAAATGIMDPLPWQGQLGVVGMMGGLLWWQMAKTIPQESRRHSEEIDRVLETHSKCSDEMKDCISGMSDDIKTMTGSMNDLNSTIKTNRK